MVNFSSVIKNYALHAVGFLFTILFQFHIVSVLSKEEFGTFSLIWSSILIASSFAVLGMDRLIIKKSAGANNEEQIHNYKLSLIIMSVTGVVATLVLIAYYKLLKFDVIAILCAIGIFFVHSATKLNEGHLIANNRVVSVNFFVSFVRPSLFLILSYGLYLISLPASLINILAIQVMVLVAIYIFTFPRSGWSPDGIQTIGSTENSIANWPVESWPFFLIGISLVINQNADLILIDLFLDKTAVANYAFASKIIIYTGVVLGLFGTIISPLIARSGLVQSGVDATNRKYAVFSLLSILAVSVFLIYVMDLFFPKYEDSVTLILVLMITFAIKALFGPVEIYLSMTGHSAEASKIMLISSVINILGNVLLIPFIGVYGAVVMALITIIYWNIMMRRKLYELRGINSLLIK